MDLRHEETFNITTFGCQMNEHDSEIMAGMLSLKRVMSRAADRGRSRHCDFQHVQHKRKRRQAFLSARWGSLKQRKNGR